MNALAFDTYKAITAPKQAGFEEAQAEAVVTTMSEALSGNGATKADLIKVRAALEADIQVVKTDLTALETRLTKPIYGVVLAGVGLTVTLTTVLLSLLQ